MAASAGGSPTVSVENMDFDRGYDSGEQQSYAKKYAERMTSAGSFLSPKSQAGAATGQYLEETAAEAQWRQRLEGKAACMVDSILEEVVPDTFEEKSPGDATALEAFSALLQSENTDLHFQARLLTLFAAK